MLFFRRASVEKQERASVERPQRDDDLVQILVRLGKLPPVALSALMVTLARTQTDNDLVEQLVRRRIVTQQDVEVAKQVQTKLREGQPIYEEWAKLEALMAENKRCAQELTAAISQKKERRRNRGEDTVMFITPKHMRSAT